MGNSLNKIDRSGHKEGGFRYLISQLARFSLIGGFTNKSAALLTVIILVIILTILSASILSLLSNQSKIVEHNISRTKAKYATEAVMVRELERLRKAQALEATHNVLGRYDNESMSWTVRISNTSSPFPAVTQVNMSLDYTSVP